ncbi:L-cystine-binding protein TcyJ [Paenibacillus swuensis]|uniref:L-cystine-binding protein TcyJ n=1 Tax=Paenibacillus swuensis TaxID=1178515 RepID=A0A172TH60_9BACL|nr:transporter substrate-binding domain-containing protein [Paenibacillus swuensis]ANE46389.1 L-cystine-binding protein TcyJ [Paenibacillus swuensis]
MKKFTLVIFTLALALLTSACGSNTNESASVKADSLTANGKAEGETAKKIIVGTANDFEQVAFLDDKGNLTGFDVELIREIDKRLEAYEFEFQTLEFSNILLSLETKKVDIAAHLFEKNPEREQKFDFNQEPYAYWRNKIIVASDNADPIKSLDDLQGKKVLIGPTSAQAQLLENYNKENEKDIDIVYQQNDANDEVLQITSGRAYATLGADFLLPIKDPQGKLKTVGEPLNEGNIQYVFRKDDPESKKLAEAIDTTIKELKADGTLKKISEEWLGQDFSK